MRAIIRNRRGVNQMAVYQKLNLHSLQTPFRILTKFTIESAMFSTASAGTFAVSVVRWIDIGIKSGAEDQTIPPRSNFRQHYQEAPAGKTFHTRATPNCAHSRTITRECYNLPATIAEGRDSLTR